MAASTYLKTLKERASESHVYTKHQLVGLEIATILGDQKHKALYMKLVKEGNGDHLMRVAKDVADRKEVKNKGAYFMTVIGDTSKTKKPVWDPKKYGTYTKK